MENYLVRFFIVLILTVSCLHPTSVIADDLNRTKLIFWGQDVKGKRPGNSLPAIDYAYQLGYDGVELDLQIAKDGIAILMHDATVDKTTNEKGKVLDRTSNEMSQLYLLPLTDSPVHVPTFEDALRANGNRGVFIADMRVKSDYSNSIVTSVRNAHFDEHLLLISIRDLGEAISFKKSLPKSGVYLKKYTEPLEIPFSTVDAVKEAGLDGLMLQVPNNDLPIDKWVEYVHAKGLKVILFVQYGNGTLKQLQNLTDSKVDYVLTVHPEYKSQLH